MVLYWTRAPCCILL